MNLKQRGLSLIGLIVVLAVLAFVGLTAAKLLPTYIDYWSVKKVLASMEGDKDFRTATDGELRRGFDRRVQVDNITAVKGDDLEITKEAGVPVVTANYSVRVPLFANISALIDFRASTSP